jgi:hypothetical protein
MTKIKLIFAIMLFACLINFPYGYYMLVRVVAMVLFGYLAYENFQSNNSTKAIIYLALAILFQPLMKISLGRTLWNVVDVVVGIGLIIDAYSTPDTKTK